MENKVTLSKLSAMLSEATGKSRKLCEDFVKELFAMVSNELAKGENVRVKGLGTFKLIEVESRKSVDVSTGEEFVIPAHNKVVFTASRELAARVNSPFEAFEAVEISDDVPTGLLEGDLEDAGEVPDNEDEAEGAEEVVESEAVKESDEVDESQSVEESEEAPKLILEADSAGEAYDDEMTREAYEAAESKTAVPEVTVSGDEEFEESESEYEEEPSRHRFAWGFLAGFVTALIGGGIVFAVGYVLGYSFGVTKGENKAEAELPEVVEQVIEIIDSVRTDSIELVSKELKSVVADKGDDVSVPTKASDSPVYDTVSTTRYLTTIAKEHYGNFNLWPIIYEENAKILGHPDRIRPGTKVVVPPLSKYGIDPKNKEQISEIKKKGVEIYARFK